MKVRTLEAASREELVAQWKQLFDQPMPAGLSRPLLVRILAWEIQARRQGGLSKRLRKQLQSAPSGNSKSKPVVRAQTGARLVREWNGVSHVVDVVEGGVLYRNERYASLSAVAKRITGAHWSGPRFFGLKTRRAA